MRRLPFGRDEGGRVPGRAGWATVHPLLVRHGWDYVQTVVWDKGVGHIAGNVNGDTIRRFPVVTEVCVFYRRRLEFPTPDGVMSAKQWLRYEWRRAGLPLHRANQACGMANAATRKYLTQDWLWYLPPEPQPRDHQRLVGPAAARTRALQGQRPALRAPGPPAGPKRGGPPQPEALGVHAPDHLRLHPPRRHRVGALRRVVQRGCRRRRTRARRLRVRAR